MVGKVGHTLVWWQSWKVGRRGGHQDASWELGLNWATEVSDSSTQEGGGERAVGGGWTVCELVS